MQDSRPVDFVVRSAAGLKRAGLWHKEQRRPEELDAVG
jgi:hypothetical protein